MYDNQTLYSSLLELHVIDDVSLRQALDDATTQQVPLGDILLERNLITDENLGKLIADLIKVSFIQLSRIKIPKDVLMTIPEVVAQQQSIVAFKKDAKGLHVAMSDPTNKETIAFLEKTTGVPIVKYYATKQDINVGLGLYLADIEKAFEQIITESVEQAKNNKESDIEPPIIRIVETIISYAYKNNASDIHLEPEETYSLVRFRIDGVLHDIIRLSHDIYPEIVMRVKVLAKLRTDEHLVPQDGKIQFPIEGKSLDIRVSIVPVLKGEKIVMRLLAERARQITLESLGFSKADLLKVTTAYKKPYGMVLATGPTGSGKTTTMYALLKLLNSREINIMTIEDPIEYDIEGVNQIQVNTKANLTFASGLRSILRQDPNVILVGEIRDAETADIAVSSAMTGHLVLSTLHTNDAATAIPRFIEMGIEPFLIGSTVNVIIAQRLVRKVHAVCKVSEEVDLTKMAVYIDPKLLAKVFGASPMIRLYKGKGCDLCHNSGFESRMGIFEVLIMDDELRNAIAMKKDSSILRSIAVKNGMQTMLEDGLEKVKQGETTLEELLRVTKE